MQPTDSLVVSGADYDHANGLYSQRGERNGHPFFVHNSSLCTIGHHMVAAANRSGSAQAWTVMGWSLACHSQQRYLTHNCDAPSPVDCTWHVRRIRGLPPVPNVTACAHDACEALPVHLATPWDAIDAARPDYTDPATGDACSWRGKLYRHKHTRR